MTREYYYNTLPDFNDVKLERELVAWLISLDLNEDNARRVCNYISEIKTDERADKRPLIDMIGQLLHIIDIELSKKVQTTYAKDINKAKQILKDYF